MPEARVELARGCPRRILSPLRLPFRHSGAGVTYYAREAVTAATRLAFAATPYAVSLAVPAQLPARSPPLARHPDRTQRRPTIVTAVIEIPDQRAQQVRARQGARHVPARPRAPQRGPLPGRLRLHPPHPRRRRRSARHPRADDDPGVHRLPRGRAAGRALPPGRPRRRRREGPRGARWATPTPTRSTTWTTSRHTTSRRSSTSSRSTRIWKGTRTETRDSRARRRRREAVDAGDGSCTRRSSRRQDRIEVTADRLPLATPAVPESPAR